MNTEDEGENEDAASKEPAKPKLCCSARLTLCFLCFIAIFNVTYVRVGISMALLCMVVPQAQQKEKAGVSSEKMREEFDWSPALKGYLISAAFYGFIAGPFIGGLVSFRFGPKVTLMVGTIGMGVSNVLAPESARLSPIMLFAVRVPAGFFGSFTFPAFYDLVSHWIVPEERQLLVTGTLVAIPVVGVVNFPISGLICNHWGWIWLFYSLSIWIACCAVLFFFLISNYPEGCRFISEKEILYIQSRIPNPVPVGIPWKKIFTSLPIYAYIVMHFCVNYVYLTMVFCLPQLMNDVNHFPLEENGFLSATPFMGSLVMRILLSVFFEQIRKKCNLSKNALRKIFVFTGAFLVSLFLITVTFLSSAHRYWVLGCFILATASLELCLTGGYLLSLLDLCPSYVNVVTGITNTIGNTAGLISPVANGLIVSHGRSEEWNAVFYVNAALLVLASTFYLVFGQNHLQEWGLARLPVRMSAPRHSLQELN